MARAAMNQLLRGMREGKKRFGSAVAICHKYSKMKWANVSAVKGKLREARQEIRCLCLLRALALAKPALKATSLFHFAGLLKKAQTNTPLETLLSIEILRASCVC
jgi:hypothetical protein